MTEQQTTEPVEDTDGQHDGPTGQHDKTIDGQHDKTGGPADGTNG